MGCCRFSDVSSRRGRPDEDLELLAELGRQILALELQGDLFASSLERVVRALPPDTFVDLAVESARTLDDAMRGREDALLVGAGRSPQGSVRIDLAEFELVRHLGEHDPARLLPRFIERNFAAGDIIVEQGAVADALYLLRSGVAEVVCFELTRPELMRLRSSDHLLYTRIFEHLLVSTAERLRRTNREASLLRD